MKKSSLKSNVLFYLTIFALIILGGVWFLQFFSKNLYYEFSKANEIKNIANKVVEAYKNSNHDLLDGLAYRKDVCIEILDSESIYYSTDSASRGCLVNNSEEISKYKLDFMMSSKSNATYRFLNPKFKNKTLLYAIKIDESAYAFISTSLEPINSTVSALQKQLIFVTIIILLISALIAYTISKKISKPIEKITSVSKEMSKGNYNIKFNTDSDIEEIKDLESALNMAVLELSKTDALRRDLLANVSHDLKTPLTLIKANAEMVKDLTYKDKEKMDKNLNTIIEEVDRLNLLVEDILNLSKMQSNLESLNLEEFNLNELIKSVIKRFDILCERDKYIIEYEGFDTTIKADKKKIDQVIYNLINNAINYTGEDKKVSIKMLDKKSSIRLEFNDTGKGIDEKDLKYIWDKYYKVDKKYKRVSYGTGLGLSIVKNVLNSHGFDYGVSSKIDVGTCFYFEIKKQKK